MQDLIKKIQERLGKSAYPNEQAVSMGIVLPILQRLGWDATDPEQVRPEYTIGNGRVDFALFGRSQRPSVFIEVKRVGVSMGGDRQLFEYAFHQGVPICILTDGREWSFYLPSGQGSYSDRRFYRLQLDDRSPAECESVLHRYLSHERVLSDQARKDAQSDYDDVAAKRDAEGVLPEAWAVLVNEPEELLIEMLGDQAEQICGHRPSPSVCQKFLQSLAQPATQLKPAKPVAPHSEDVTPSHPEPQLSNARRRTPQHPNSREVSFKLFGEARTARSGKDAFVDILAGIAERYPDRMQQVADAARGTKRNHIARTVEEVYPNRPDLANAYEFTPGWLVGLNIANREKMRIIRAACEVCGIAFGAEVSIDLPNA